MVTLSSIRATNTRLRDTLPPNLVSLFVGGTSGIGEATLLELASHSRKPKIYIVARRAEAGERVIAAARKANPDGEYVFVPSDAGSMRETEGLAAYIAAREQRLDLVLLSAGLPLINKEKSPEGLHALLAISYYSRCLLLSKLTPLLDASASAGHHPRVVTLAGGDSEGRLAVDDLPAWHVSFSGMNAHVSTLTTLALEGLAADAPGVGFVTTYPGFVETPYHRLFGGFFGWVVWFMDFFLGWAVNMPLKESAERHLWLLTARPFRGRSGAGAEAVRGDNDELAIGTDGTRGSGIYSVDWKGEGGSEKALAWLRGYRSEGMVEKIKAHNEGEFERIRAGRGM